MESKNIKFIEVDNLFHLGNASTGEIVQNFKRLMEAGILDKDKAVLCTINYDTRVNDIEIGPVRIYFSDGICVRLNLTAGYGGTGPRDTCRILNLCEFNFDESDILSKSETVTLKYYKDHHNKNVYQFELPDGSYVYSTL